ncbi:hypothetical protein [Streptomyces rishiriensis]|uniref:hypothetical protein n=1 Tax=Streptomyces rishiriensis TaxID=68264 RepID=UPI000D5990FC|nr:hypothetical protein [Streptomyces rishiriensis]
MTEHATSRLPIATSTDGQAYLAADAVVELLRAIAASCRMLADDPDYSLDAVAIAIEMEADNLDCRAIERTR